MYICPYGVILTESGKSLASLANICRTPSDSLFCRQKGAAHYLAFVRRLLLSSDFLFCLRTLWIRSLFTVLPRFPLRLFPSLPLLCCCGFRCGCFRPYLYCAAVVSAAVVSVSAFAASVVSAAVVSEALSASVSPEPRTEVLATSRLLMTFWFTSNLDLSISS